MNSRICRVIVPSKNDICGDQATHIIEFRDETRIDACTNCMLNLRQTAETHGTNIKVEKYELVTSNANAQVASKSKNL
jgi:hypothetical protein